MEISKILTADILDIVFEGKNKEYGAYELRKSYAGRLRLAITVTGSIVLLCVAGFLFADQNKLVTLTTFDIPEPMLTKLAEDKVIPPPVVPPPTVKQPEVMERRNLDIVVVPDNKVPPDEEVPLNEDLENARFSLVNKAGADFDNIPAPIEESVGKGIIERPKRENPDSVFLSVEIESSYPGGIEAWRRFLIKNLSNNYPQDAAERGIQGKVVVLFIVDKDGNVSNVHAIEGPKELHDLATKVIKKSGKWQPAQQNGKIVNSYKRQPIVFTLAEE
ncbi:energy transducer TonB [Flavitalea sp.]|nr:energy transducer TonB [Flavitalea sp.]